MVYLRDPLIAFSSFLSSLRADSFHSILKEAIVLQFGDQSLMRDSRFLSPLGHSSQVLSVLDQFSNSDMGRITDVFSPFLSVTYCG
jgi:hypothetical protein